MTALLALVALLLHACGGSPKDWDDVDVGKVWELGSRGVALCEQHRFDEAAEAWAEVVELEANMAKVELSGTDRFNPIASGDLIVNPVYHRSGDRQAVLAGRFSSPSEPDLIALLARMGIQVQDEVTVETDYLIVGSELYLDPETGEPLEEAMPVSELPVYKDAESTGVLILPIRDLRNYFLRM